MSENILKLTDEERLVIQVALDMEIDRMREFVETFKDYEELNPCIEMNMRHTEVLKGVLKKLDDLKMKNKRVI